jgi:hypothetical protein
LAQPEVNAPRRAWPNLDAAHLTHAFAGLYVIGFIVSNVHFAQYQLLRFELLRSRYLAAGLLFFVLSAVPAGFEIFLSVALRSTADSTVGFSTPGRILRETEVWAMGCGHAVAFSALGLMLYSVLAVQISLPSRSWLALAAYFAMTGLISWYLGDFFFATAAVPAGHSQVWPSTRLAQSIWAPVVWLVALPAAFGKLVYDTVRPEFGGGAVWVARVAWRETAPPAVRGLAPGIVAVVDRNDATLTLLACNPPTGRERTPPRVVTVAASEVVGLELVGVVALPAFAKANSRTCP